MEIKGKGLKPMEREFYLTTQVRVFFHATAKACVDFDGKTYFNQL